MAKVTFSRKDFYDLVWSESLAAISRKYNISYPCLREVCNEMQIPVPPNGYWSKLRFGKSEQKDNLWESTKAKQEISLWLRSDEDGEEYISENTAQLIKNKTEISKKINPVESKTIKSHEVDPLILITKQYYSQIKSGNRDYSKEQKSLDISVSDTLLNRSIRLMEQFIHLMKVCGHSVIVKEGKTYAVILGEELQISLMEKSNRITVVDKSWTYTKLKHNGKLSLRYIRYSVEHEWIDNNIPLEDKLVDIIAKLEVYANKNKIEREEREKYREAQRVKEQKRKELKERKEKELNDFKSIFQKASRFQKAIELRNYIDTFEKYSIKNNSLTEDIKNWIEWARKKADWYDPFIEAEDELLNDVDKDSLTFN